MDARVLAVALTVTYWGVALAVLVAVLGEARRDPHLAADLRASHHHPLITAAWVAACWPVLMVTR